MIAALKALVEELRKSRAHTYASENADHYRGFDAGVRYAADRLAAILRQQAGGDGCYPILISDDGGKHWHHWGAGFKTKEAADEEVVRLSELHKGDQFRVGENAAPTQPPAPGEAKP